MSVTGPVPYFLGYLMGYSWQPRPGSPGPVNRRVFKQVFYLSNLNLDLEFTVLTAGKSDSEPGLARVLPVPRSRWPGGAPRLTGSGDSLALARRRPGRR
jgi:hypothetical protein